MRYDAHIQSHPRSSPKWYIYQKNLNPLTRIQVIIWTPTADVFGEIDLSCHEASCTAYLLHGRADGRLREQGKSEGFDSGDRPSNLKLDSNRQFFRPCDHEIWWMTSKNNRALLLYYVKLCASFQIHWWIQTGFTVQLRSIRVEIGDMLSRVTLKFDGWPWKTIGHLFYATSSFVQHFVAIGEFKQELKSGNAQFW